MNIFTTSSSSSSSLWRQQQQQQWVYHYAQRAADAASDDDDDDDDVSVQAADKLWAVGSDITHAARQVCIPIWSYPVLLVTITADAGLHAQPGHVSVCCTSALIIAADAAAILVVIITDDDGVWRAKVMLHSPVDSIFLSLDATCRLR